MTPMTDTSAYALSLLGLQQRIQATISNSGFRSVWITAELSDVRSAGPHCYMELIEKDEKGATIAKARATIWANNWIRIRPKFRNATGQEFASGLKVMVQVNAEYHPLYGMNLNITEVNPSYTLGERDRRRREILERLKADGVYDNNRELEFPRPCLRIAIISAEGAAGYGDFMNQLHSNGRNLRFQTGLFPAIMQGNQVPASVIGQLNSIAADEDNWDCVCIIRGGGASTDLDGFDDYELASNVAQFPLPVVIGIGHERDTTVLDYICAQRVKTPTAAAEFLIGMALEELEILRRYGASILRYATESLGGSQQQLAYLSGRLPNLALQAVERAERRLDNAARMLGHMAETVIMPLGARLDRFGDAIKSAAHTRLQLAAHSLKSRRELLEALSPAAVLARGFSITRINGKAVTDAATVKPGDVVTTTLAQGEISSTVN